MLWSRKFKMPLCTLHIGLPKSGSTSIQSMIFANRKQLARHGIYVPEASTNGYRRADHHMLAWEFIGKSAPRDVEGHREALKSELVRQRNPDHILITSEYFQDKLGSVPYIENLRAYFAALGYRLRIVAYVRPQPEYINSNYAQNVKLLFNKLGISEYVERSLNLDRFDYQKHLLPAFLVGGIDVVYRPFNRKIMERGIGADFLNTLGLDDQAIAGMRLPTVENVSPGPKTLALCLAISRRLAREGIELDDDNRYKASRVLQDLGDDLDWNAVKFAGITRKAAQRMRRRFITGNDKFAAAVWQQSWHEVFGDDCWTPPPYNVFHRNKVDEDDKSEFNCILKSAWKLLEFDKRNNKRKAAEQAATAD